MATQQAPDAGSGSGVPTCYRHAGRETYLSCTRCGRPACPECLRSAPVGQQCVECVREGGGAVRRPAGVFGGRSVSGAVVTWTLVALNVAFYLVEWVYPKIVDYLALIGSAYDPNVHGLVGVAQGQEYRLLTSAFLHEQGFGGGHFRSVRCGALILVGPALERLLGWWRFLGACSARSAVMFYLLAPVNELGLGASGAIFGLFGAFSWCPGAAGGLPGDRVPDLVNLVISFAVSRHPGRRTWAA
jgi:hypothetical protein